MTGNNLLFCSRITGVPKIFLTGDKPESPPDRTGRAGIIIERQNSDQQKFRRDDRKIIPSLQDSNEIIIDISIIISSLRDFPMFRTPMIPSLKPL